jgi:hypothetical protein
MRRQSAPTAGAAARRVDHVAGAAAAGEVEAQVDVELFEQRQGDGRAAGGGAHVGQQAGEGGLVGAAGDEPQVVAVLAPVVVIDAGEGVDDGRHAGQVGHRHGHRGEGAGADAVGGEDRPDAADLAAVRSAASRASTSPAPQPSCAPRPPRARRPAESRAGSR